MSCNLIQIVAVLAALYPGTQPARSQVQNLAHFDVVATNSFTEADGRSYGISGAGMTISNERVKFGANALKITGTTYLGLNRTTADCFGTGDFTAEIWINPTTLAGGTANGVNAVMNLGNGGVGGMALWFNSAGVACFDVAKATRIQSAAGAIVLNQWTHLAVTRRSGLFTLWINGIAAGTYTDATFNHTESYDFLGWCYIPNGGGYYNGYMDELRIVKGLAVYANNFAVPTQPYALPTS